MQAWHSYYIILKDELEVWLFYIQCHINDVVNNMTVRLRGNFLHCQCMELCQPQPIFRNHSPLSLPWWYRWLYQDEEPSYCISLDFWSPYRREAGSALYLFTWQSWNHHKCKQWDFIFLIYFLDILIQSGYWTLDNLTTNDKMLKHLEKLLKDREIFSFDPKTTESCVSRT
jgi:hypothetical protein